MDLDPSDKGPRESSKEDYKDPAPKPTWVGRIDGEFLIAEPNSFSRKGEDGLRWLLAMKAHFKINKEHYADDKKIVIVFLNKLTTGRATTFAEGWYMKQENPETTADKLFKAFEETFIPRDIQD